MIDRSYLPFQAAREYQDPGMQKWMGFFLSEHTSSLHAAKYRVDFSTDLSKPQKLLLISQLTSPTKVIFLSRCLIVNWPLSWLE